MVTMTTTADPFERLARARAAAGDHPDVIWVFNIIECWARHALADGRQRALQRYFGFGTAVQMRRYLRDRALVEAARYLDVTGGQWTVAVTLEREWRRFAACSAWVADIERRQEPPPEVGSGLRRALWHATKHAGGRLLDERRIADILRGAGAR
jgi:hypothetical protein